MSTERHGALKAAAVFAWLAGFGFGLPCAYGLIHFARHGDVWNFLGFPTYGGGPFVDVGIETTTALLGAFLLVCALEVVDGLWLWRSRPRGMKLSFLLLPFELAFWIGFALPFGFAVGLARTGAVIYYMVYAMRP